MSLPEPKVGLVIRYAYLWRHEAEQGRQEASKDRPCAVVVAVRREGGDIQVMVSPITTRAPSTGESVSAVEIPEATRRRLRLDDRRSWLMATEVNRFTWPGVDLRPVSPGSGRFDYGFLPGTMMEALRRKLLEAAQRGGLRPADRD